MTLANGQGFDKCTKKVTLQTSAPFPYILLISLVFGRSSDLILTSILKKAPSTLL